MKAASLGTTRFKCVRCGKLTTGRIPVNPHNHREVGDGTFRYPRRHKLNGELCPGVYEEAEWVGIDKRKDNPHA